MAVESLAKPRILLTGGRVQGSNRATLQDRGSSPSAAGSCQLAGFLEGQTRMTGEQGGRVAIAEIAQEVDPRPPRWKELPLYADAIKPRHRSAVEPKRTRR